LEESTGRHDGRLDAGAGLDAELLRWVCDPLFKLRFSPESYRRDALSITDTSRRVISLLIFVSRSKLVPDFALTIHFLHLVVTSLYSKSIPQNWLWWALQVASVALMISLGVWSCQWRELRPINFGSSNTAQNNTISENIEVSQDGGDMEQGYGRGRGRGRGRDGAGEYEMVGMKPEEETTPG
jgi:hypothetical protein